MKKLQFGSILSLGLFCALGVAPVEALPGDRTETVTAWIAAHPTLRSGVGETLTVKRDDTPAQRFRFQASVLPPGRASLPTNPGIIRSEKFSIFDLTNGVPPERLEESLRDIYGLDIYEDYAQAVTVYAYPTRETLELARRQNLPALGAQRGELREGKRFAYWIEVTYSEEGMPLNGQVTLFLKEDLDKLAAELRDR